MEALDKAFLAFYIILFNDKDTHFLLKCKSKNISLFGNCFTPLKIILNGRKVFFLFKIGGVGQREQGSNQFLKQF